MTCLKYFNIITRKNMFLEIVLTVLTIVLILMSLGVYLWWRTYGKKIFTMMNKIQSLGNQKNMDLSSIKNMDMLLKQMNGILGRFKK